MWGLKEVYVVQLYRKYLPHNEEQPLQATFSFRTPPRITHIEFQNKIRTLRSTRAQKIVENM